MVTAASPGSGKLATCLNNSTRTSGIDAGYAKLGDVPHLVYALGPAP